MGFKRDWGGKHGDNADFRPKNGYNLETIEDRYTCSYNGRL